MGVRLAGRRLRGISMRAPWIAVVLAAFVAGAGTVLLADPGTSDQRVVVAPVGSSSPSAHDDHATTINGQKISGVKLEDIAAEEEPDKPLDAETRALVAMQLVQARATAMRYPTVQHALDAGYIVAGGFAPGSGAHYVSISRSGFGGGPGLDIEHPGSLIYEGTNPGSKIIGLMYLGGG